MMLDPDYLDMYRQWKVHLAVPGTTHNFTYEVIARTEAGALAMALAEYPHSYVRFTEEVRGGTDKG